MANNETIFFIANENIEILYKNCDKVIRYLGEYMDIIDKNLLYLVLVKDFPFFEMNDGQIGFCHNPFSKPQEVLWNNLIKTKAYQYDFVLNGYEIASGSERNTDLSMLKKLFEICGYDNFDESFGCFNLFKLGVPPHAGCAVGFDRLLMILMDLENIRDTQAFPLSPSGCDTLMGCPSSVSEKQLKELGIKLVQSM
jgi:aspartyl-tRNA synthetase